MEHPTIFPSVLSPFLPPPGLALAGSLCKRAPSDSVVYHSPAARGAKQEVIGMWVVKEYLAFSYRRPEQAYCIPRWRHRLVLRQQTLSPRAYINRASSTPHMAFANCAGEQGRGGRGVGSPKSTLDDERLIFFEPNVAEVWTSGFSTGPSGHDYDDHQVYSCPPATSDTSCIGKLVRWGTMWQASSARAMAHTKFGACGLIWLNGEELTWSRQEGLTECG